ncbi:TRAP transporter large permease [Mesorhizobium marinum]|uniref:TRAP transporter large permease n=1 Tax=Mesorhizobium marinum TaxID=3228790 RepID=UPI00346516E1
MIAPLVSFMMLLLAGGLPVAVAVGLAGILTIHFFSSLPPVLIGQQFYVAIDKFSLVAIPFFVLAGNIMEVGGISQRLIDFAKSLVGEVRGSLALTCVLACMIFAAVSGSGTATTFAIGAIMIPALQKHGYPTPWAASLQATSAELGVIIPPSIPLILYGVAADVSIGELFVASVLPGLLVGGALMAYVLVWTRFSKAEISEGVDGYPVLVAFRRGAFALFMPVIILGGIYGGVFTPTEASVVAVFYALFVALVVHREMSWRDIPAVLHKTVISSTIIMFIIAAAGLFSFMINRSGAPAMVTDWLFGMVDGPIGFLLTVNLFLLVVGMFIEGAAAIIVLAPILAPVAIAFGVDPVHFGIVMVVNLALGFVTPPFGVNLFAACTVAKIPADRVFRPILPFIGTVLVALTIITFLPQISLFLRDLVYR